jgi:hypothetical protein
MPPKPGDRIVLDTQMLADYLLGAVRPTQRSQAAEITFGPGTLLTAESPLSSPLQDRLAPR